VVDYKQILRLRAEGVSQRGIADALGYSRNTVAVVFAAAKAQGMCWEEVAGLDPNEVRHQLSSGPAEKTSNRVQPDFGHVHREIARPNVTLLLLWNEYAARCRAEGTVPYQYSTFCQSYRQWAAVSGATMRMIRQPGQSTEVDWAGDTMMFIDPLNSMPATAYLFVAALSYSAYGYVEAFADMTLDSWIEAHINAFEFFGGTTRLLIPDNLRAGVSKSDRYEPVLNPAYSQLADHYGTAIVPARVKHPRDKAVAEGAVFFLANQVGAILRDRRFIGLGELNQAIFEQVEQINARQFQKREDSRLVVFQRDEEPLLNPLPATRFEIAVLKKAKVAVNYHVQVDDCFYSVPARLIGQTLDVRVTTKIVEVFAGMDRVASHTRLKGKGRYSTVEEHMPASHRAQLRTWTPERFTDWAERIGPSTVKVITAILASRKIVEQSYRSCLGVMSLAKKNGGAARLEDACTQALSFTLTPSYTMVKRLWTDWQPMLDPGLASLGETGFVRGADYYQQEGGEQS